MEKGRVPLRHVLFFVLYHFPFYFFFSERNSLPHGIVTVNGYPEPKGGDLLPREHEDWVRQLYLTHAPDLYRAARYRLQDPELAYDLTQEVFLTLLDKQAQVNHHPNPCRVALENPSVQAGARLFSPGGPGQIRGRAGRPGLAACPAPRHRRHPGRDSSPTAAGTGPPTAENGLRGGPDLRGNQPASGHSPATCGTWLYRARQRCKHYLTLSEGGNPVEKT